MKAIQLRPYQIKAMEAIQGALDSGQKHMVVEMASGTGKGFVFAKTVELLHKQTLSSVLVITNRMALKKNVENNLFDKHQDFVRIDKNRITVTTEQRILRYANKEFNDHQFIIFYELDVSESIYEMLNCREKTVIVFLKNMQRNPTGFLHLRMWYFHTPTNKRLMRGTLLRRWMLEPLILQLRCLANSY